MRTEYTVTTPHAPSSTHRPLFKAGAACAASGVIGVVIGIITLSYPAAVKSDRWSYPFDATGQWIVSIVLALTHLLALAGLVGVIRANAYGRSRAAMQGIRVAIVGYAGLALCEVFSGTVGAQSNKSSAADAAANALGIASLLTAFGSIVAGVVIARRHGIRSGWSMVLWSGIALVVLVTPANISGNQTLTTVALIVWSLTFVPLGQTLIRSDKQAG